MSDWKHISSAPYGKVLLVKNRLMEKPVRATRGYVYNGMVHADQNIFTSVYTPDEFFPFPAGHPVVPEEWMEIDDDA